MTTCLLIYLAGRWLAESWGRCRRRPACSGAMSVARILPWRPRQSGIDGRVEAAGWRIERSGGGGVGRSSDFGHHVERRLLRRAEHPRSRAPDATSRRRPGTVRRRCSRSSWGNRGGAPGRRGRRLRCGDRRDLLRRSGGDPGRSGQGARRLDREPRCARAGGSAEAPPAHVEGWRPHGGHHRDGQPEPRARNAADRHRRGPRAGLGRARRAAAAEPRRAAPHARHRHRRQEGRAGHRARAAHPPDQRR